MCQEDLRINLADQNFHKSHSIIRALKAKLKRLDVPRYSLYPFHHFRYNPDQTVTLYQDSDLDLGVVPIASRHDLVRDDNSVFSIIFIQVFFWGNMGMILLDLPPPVRPRVKFVDTFDLKPRSLVRW